MTKFESEDLQSQGRVIPPPSETAFSHVIFADIGHENFTSDVAVDTGNCQVCQPNGVEKFPGARSQFFCNLSILHSKCHV